MVVCKKSGYVDTENFAESGYEGSVLGNLIIGGLVGAGVDMLSGAYKKYPEYITVNLVPTHSPK